MKKSMLIIVMVISGCSVNRYYEGNYIPDTPKRPETFSGCKDKYYNNIIASLTSVETCMENSGFKIRSQTGLETLMSCTLLLPFSTLGTIAGAGLFIDYYVPIGQKQYFDIKKYSK